MRDFMLLCPKCQEKLTKEGNSLRCKNHHSFDIARRGYANLLLGNRKGTGDDKDMVRARTRFLSQGYYQPLCTALCEQLKRYHPTCIVDAGCGEGFYTNQIRKALPMADIYGFDLSKYAVDEACKAHLDITYAVCSVFHMPLGDECCEAVVSVFAPFDIMEIARVLKQGGYFLKVGPGPQHLMDLKRVLYEEVYENDDEEVAYPGFVHLDTSVIDYSVMIEGQDHLQALFQMTPYYWKTPKEGKEALRALDELKVRIQFKLDVYQKL